MSRAGRSTAVELVTFWRNEIARAILEPAAPVVLGCSPDVALSIDDPGLAREHARFTRAGDEVWLEPIGSRSFVFIGESRVSERVVLEPDTDVRAGSVTVRVRARELLTPVADSAPYFRGPATRGLLEAIGRLATTRVPVLLLGETGSGKELIAERLHTLGDPKRPLIRVNCGALPQQLVESTLFGHERGAFTGADQRRSGVFEAANGGTVFLDEIGELSPAAQASMLRVLENGTFTRVGSHEEQRVSVRVVAATHRALEGMVAAGTFRADLFYRLSTVVLEVPALRARRCDIEPIARRLVAAASQAYAREVHAIDARVISALESCDWPGNVRELKNVISRMVVMANTPILREDDLPKELRAASSSAPSQRPIPSPTAVDEDGEDATPGPELRDRMANYERKLIEDALRRANGSRAEAAKLLNLPLRTFSRRMVQLKARSGRPSGARLSDVPISVAEAVDADGEPPVKPTAREVPNNLERSVTRFVGRARELTEIARLFKSGVPIVTLLGVGGAGKTRLAHAFGSAHLDEFVGGVRFCDLTEARDELGVCVATARGLGVPLGAKDPVEAVGRALAGDEVSLVILDNFEQVIEAAPQTLGRWVAAAPSARFLVTSRVRLRIPGEEVFGVEPLDVPPDGPVDLEALIGSPAVALFIDRARAASPSFKLTSENAAAIVRLLRAIDGLPLAIELAAARVRVLAPAQIEERLRKRFDLLQSGERGAKSRQGTLRSAIDWSWDLLESWEKAALAACSVFSGGFDIDAAEAVVDLSAWPGAPLTLDVIQALVDKSLIRVRDAAFDERAHRYELPNVHFGMYVSIQEYAKEKLALGELGSNSQLEAEQRHALHYAALGDDDVAMTIEVGADVRMVRKLFSEAGNVAMALTRSLAAGDRSVVYRIARASAVLHKAVGPRVVGRANLIGALELALEDRQRLILLRLLLHFERTSGTRDAAIRVAQDTFNLAQCVDDPLTTASAFLEIGRLWTEEARFDEGRAALELAGERARAAGDATLVAQSRLSLNEYSWRFKDAAGNRRDCEEALELAERCGSGTLVGYSLHNLGDALRAEGRPEEAIGRFEQAIEKMQETMAWGPEAHTRATLADVYFELGRFESGRAAAAIAVEIATRVGYGPALVVAHRALAFAGFLSRDLELAREQIARALEHGKHDYELNRASTHCTRALVLAASGDQAGATADLALVDEIVQRTKVSHDNEVAARLRDARRRIAGLGRVP